MEIKKDITVSVYAPECYYAPSPSYATAVKLVGEISQYDNDEFQIFANISGGGISFHFQTIKGYEKIQKIFENYGMNAYRFFKIFNSQVDKYIQQPT